MAHLSSNPGSALAGARGLRSCRLAVALLLGLLPVVVPAQTRSETADVLREEVVVTARKVEENVQDVPMSMDVLDAEFLEQAHISRPIDLQFNVPGLVINNFGAGARFTLRGIGDEGGSGVSVATHLNGIYLGSANLAIARMFDLERVEVLKGPQGTLYGRNATGGSMNFITRGPQSIFDAGIELAYGSFETVRSQGHLNVPFGDRSALRVAFVASDGEGYIRNLLDDRRFGEDDFWGVRGSYRLDFAERVEINLMAQHVTDDGARGQVWVPRPDFLPVPGDIRATRVTLADPFQKTDSDNANLDIDVDLGFATLRSVTGYARNRERENRDLGGQPALVGGIRQVRPADYEQRSQELQFISPDDAALDWIAGAYYFYGASDDRFFLILPILNPLPQNDSSGTSSEKAYAVFGQATYRPAERWSLTAGLRFSEEERSISLAGTGIADPQVLHYAEDSWSDVSWRFDAQYEPAEEVMVYGSLSKGFKSGGVTTRLLANGEFDTFEPENLLAYELGVKSQLLDRRLTLNAAAFYYGFKDLQVLTNLFTGATIEGQVDNAAKARIYGIDLGGEFQITDRLSFTGGALYMPEAKFVEFQADAGVDISGNRISRAPERTVTAAIDYRHPLGALGSFSSRLEYNFRSHFFFLKENTPVIAQDDFGLLNVQLRFESGSERWYLFAAGRNLLDEDYFTQVGFQSNPGLPLTYEVGFGVRY